jgi:alpha-galactosidase
MESRGLPTQSRISDNIHIQTKEHFMKRLAILTILAVAMLATTTLHAAKPLKVFILAGQSNMQGFAHIRTIDYIGEDPKTAPIYKEMRGPDGKSRVCEHAWISMYTTDDLTAASGKLTAGYGAGYAPGKLGSCIGPEFTFGIYMSKAVKEPILIIKTAWGGLSLSTNFRPPSAGPYVFPEPGKGAKAPTEEQKKKQAEATGAYYRYMVEHVKNVLKDIKRVCPEYQGQGYEIAGFVWLQGWNDMTDHATYPNADYTKYSEWLADFIRDVRKDLNAPDMPFVIGVMGVEGDINNIEPRYIGFHRAFRAAMAAPAAMPEFKGRVVAVQTAPFWPEELTPLGKKYATLLGAQSKLVDTQVKEGKLSKEEAAKQLKEFKNKMYSAEDAALLHRATSNFVFHYCGSAKVFAQMGKAFAEALVPLQKP